MTATQYRVCVEAATGMLRMVVAPDNDAQLNDPAFSPADCISVNVAKPTYATWKNITDTLNGVQPAVAAVDANVGNLITATIAKMALPPPVILFAPINSPDDVL